jgi:hypothetical protein
VRGDRAARDPQARIAQQRRGGHPLPQPPVGRSGAVAGGSGIHPTACGSGRPPRDPIAGSSGGQRRGKRLVSRGGTAIRRSSLYFNQSQLLAGFFLLGGLTDRSRRATSPSSPFGHSFRRGDGRPSPGFLANASNFRSCRDRKRSDRCQIFTLSLSGRALGFRDSLRLSGHLSVTCGRSASASPGDPSDYTGDLFSKCCKSLSKFPDHLLPPGESSGHVLQPHFPFLNQD